MEELREIAIQRTLEKGEPKPSLSYLPQACEEEDALPSYSQAWCWSRRELELEACFSDCLRGEDLLRLVRR